MKPQWTIKVAFIWYDIWVGVFIDRPKRTVYIAPLPCIVFKVTR